jgi:hypothetical protein
MDKTDESKGIVFDLEALAAEAGAGGDSGPRWAYFWRLISRSLGFIKPGINLDKEIGDHSTTEGYLLGLACGDTKQGGAIGAMWRRLDATQRAIVLAAWSGQADPELARSHARRDLSEIDAALMRASRPRRQPTEDDQDAK